MLRFSHPDYEEAEHTVLVLWDLDRELREPSSHDEQPMLLKDLTLVPKSRP